MRRFFSGQLPLQQNRGKRLNLFRSCVKLKPYMPGKEGQAMGNNRIRKRAAIIFGGAAYELFASFGWQAQHLAESRPLMGLFAAALLAVPACAVLRLLLAASERHAKDMVFEEKFSAWRAFAAILVCYVPMFAVTFPGSFSYDVPFQLEQVFTGSYSSHHPLLHTLLLGGCVYLGQSLGSINLGAALYTALQMTGLAACFAASCASIARQAGARAAKWSAFFFALYPLHMCMAVNATKDVLFGGLFVLTLALARETMAAQEASARRDAGLVLAAAGMMLLRNNALYAVIAFIAVILIILRGRALRMAGVMVLAVCLCTAGNAAIKRATNAAEGDLCEMLSWPIQQLARARNLHGDVMTAEELAAIDTLMPAKSWRLYDKTISDPVKFEFDTQAFLSDPGKYVRVYLSLGGRCPKAYFDALLYHTYSFWYPYSEYGVSGYYLQMGISDSFYEWCDFERISSQSLMPRVLASLSWRFGAQGAMQIPVVGCAFNMGVIVWVMLYFALREWYLGRWTGLAAAALPVLLWGTFLLGPVMAGRYIYPFVCCLPVMVCHTRKIIRRN